MNKIKWKLLFLQMILPPSIYDLALPPVPMGSPCRLQSRREPGLKQCDAGWCKPHSRFWGSHSVAWKVHKSWSSMGLSDFLRVLGKKNDGLSIGGQTFFRACRIKQHYTSKVSQFFGLYAQTDNLTSIQYFGILVNNPYFTHIYKLWTLAEISTTLP